MSSFQPAPVSLSSRTFNSRTYLPREKGGLRAYIPYLHSRSPPPNTNLLTSHPYIFIDVDSTACYTVLRDALLSLLVGKMALRGQQDGDFTGHLSLLHL